MSLETVANGTEIFRESLQEVRELLNFRRCVLFNIKILEKAGAKLRWLNTVLREVSGNLRNGACFKLDKQNEKPMVHRRRFLKIYSSEFRDISQNFSFYRILSNENFKMEVAQTNFVTHLLITVQLNN